MKPLIALLALSMSSCASTSPEDAVIAYLSLYHAASAGDGLLVAALLERGAPVDAPHPDSAGQLSYHAVNYNSPLQMPLRSRRRRPPSRIRYANRKEHALTSE